MLFHSNCPLDSLIYVRSGIPMLQGSCSRLRPHANCATAGQYHVLKLFGLPLSLRCVAWRHSTRQSDRTLSLPVAAPVFAAGRRLMRAAFSGRSSSSLSSCSDAAPACVSCKCIQHFCRIALICAMYTQSACQPSLSAAVGNPEQRLHFGAVIVITIVEHYFSQSILSFRFCANNANASYSYRCCICCYRLHILRGLLSCQCQRDEASR